MSVKLSSLFDREMKVYYVTPSEFELYNADTQTHTIEHCQLSGIFQFLKRGYMYALPVFVATQKSDRPNNVTVPLFHT